MLALYVLDQGVPMGERHLAPRLLTTESFSTALCVRRPAMGIEISLLCERLSAPGCAAQVRPDQPSVPSPCMSRLVLLHFVLSVEGPLTQTTPKRVFLSEVQIKPRRQHEAPATPLELTEEPRQVRLLVRR